MLTPPWLPFLALLFSGVLNMMPVSDIESHKGTEFSNSKNAAEVISGSEKVNVVNIPADTQAEVVTNHKASIQENASNKEIEEVPVLITKGCHPSYSGCLDADAGDYDCEGGTGNGPLYTGPVEVLGPDVFKLDRDHDGIGCN